MNKKMMNGDGATETKTKHARSKGKALHSYARVMPIIYVLHSTPFSNHYI